MSLLRRRFGLKAASEEGLLRLSGETKEVVTKSDANLKEWRKLVGQVGANKAVEHAEASAARGMADAVEAVMQMALVDWESGTVPADVAVGTVKDLGERFLPKLDEVATAHILATTEEDFDAVGSVAYVYVEEMVDIGERFVAGTITPDQREEWEAQKRTYDYVCDRFDRRTGRRRLPLGGD